MKTSKLPTRFFLTAANALLGLMLTSSLAYAAIEELDSSTINNSNSGELACSAPGRVAISASARLPAVAGEITEVKLHGSNLNAADLDFSLSGCNGDCVVISAIGSGAQSGIMRSKSLFIFGKCALAVNTSIVARA